MQLTDDERAALGRYRVGSDLVKNPKTTRQQLHTIWPEPDDYDGDDPWSWVYGMDADQEILADLALREHPADEGEKVTEEWLLSIGFKKGSSPRARPLYRDCVTFESVERGVVSICDFTELAILNTKFTTRGDVYRLLRALGIEVKG